MWALFLRLALCVVMFPQVFFLLFQQTGLTKTSTLELGQGSDFLSTRNDVAIRQSTPLVAAWAKVWTASASRFSLPVALQNIVLHIAKL